MAAGRGRMADVAHVGHCGMIGTATLPTQQGSTRLPPLVVVITASTSMGPAPPHDPMASLVISPALPPSLIGRMAINGRRIRHDPPEPTRTALPPSTAGLHSSFMGEGGSGGRRFSRVERIRPAHHGHGTDEPPDCSVRLLADLDRLGPPRHSTGLSKCRNSKEMPRECPSDEDCVR